MRRIVWWSLVAALVLLAGFILYLTLSNPDVPLRGFLLVAALLLIAAYPVSKAREAAAPNNLDAHR